MMKCLSKHSSAEPGKVWWFLDEAIDFQHFEWCTQSFA